MPTDVQVLYREKPPAGITGPPATKTSPSQTQPRSGGSTGQSSSSSSLNNGQASSNNVPIIAGSVIGSVAAICPIVLAFYLGRRGFTRKATKPEHSRANDGNGEKAELHAMPISSQPRKVITTTHSASEPPDYHPRTYELPS